MNQKLTSVKIPSKFSTYDLGCAAALVTAHFELIGLDNKNPRKVQFIFNRVEGLDKAVDDYCFGKLEINARTFFDNLKMLKNRIYSQ